MLGSKVVYRDYKLRKSKETSDTYPCMLMRALTAMIHHLVLDSQYSFKVLERGWLVPRLGSVGMCEVSLPGRHGVSLLEEEKLVA